MHNVLYILLKKKIKKEKVYVYQRKKEAEEATYDNRMANKC